jgi:RNA polymerase sigma factor (sigma-70 family)
LQMRQSNLDGLETYDAIAREHAGSVFRMLARLTGRQDDLDDMAQEVFLRLFRALPHFRGEAKLSTFLHRIVINVVKDEWTRKRKAQQVVSLDDESVAWGERLAHSAPNPGQRAEQSQFLTALDAGMKQLEIDERAILTLHYQEERSYQEIAAILELPMGTVKTNLFRAKQRLRSILKEWISSCQKPPIAGK